MLGSQIAFKCGSWNQNVTDVQVKDIHYIGQETAEPDPEPDPDIDVETEVISTEEMDVYVAKDFPSVVKYEMKGV